MVLIKVTGKDAKKLLQGQLTCHLDEITEQTFRLGAYCNVQGRAIATFYLFYWQDAYYFIVHEKVAAILLTTLKKYSVFFQVQLDIVSNGLALFGIQEVTAEFYAQNDALQSNEQSPMLLGVPAYVAHANHEGISLGVPGVFKRSIIVCLNESLLFSRLDSLSVMPDVDLWRLLDIVKGIAHVDGDTKEQYIPIELNYDLIQGINFKKGCYTGQEIIARMHYKGKPKFRVAYISFVSDEQVHANQSFYVQTSEGIRHVFAKLLSWVKLAQENHALVLINQSLLASMSLDEGQLITIDEPRLDIYLRSNIYPK